MTLNGHYAHMFIGAHHKKFNEGTPIQYYQQQNPQRMDSSFWQYKVYVGIGSASLQGEGDRMECMGRRKWRSSLLSLFRTFMHEKGQHYLLYML